MRTALSILAVIACVSCASMSTKSDQRPIEEDPAIRRLIANWNTAYRKLDAKALAALETPDLEIIDRFGHWVRSEGPEFSERMWAATFTEIYKGKPGPPRNVERVRMLSRDVAVVQATANWPALTLDDGTTIPPHGEIDTFVLVKGDQGWRIAALNIHNQMRPGSERPGERVPIPSKPPAAK